MYMDEIHFKIFRRRTLCKSVDEMPNIAPEGPTVHVIGAISSTFGPELMDLRRGALNAARANKWLTKLAEAISSRGIPLWQLVIVCDNAPVHAEFEEVSQEMGFELLRLEAYTPALNPMESIWREAKAKVKALNEVPLTNESGVNVIEQRLSDLEKLLNESIAEVTPLLCNQNIGRSSQFHEKALSMQNM